MFWGIINGLSCTEIAEEPDSRERGSTGCRYQLGGDILIASNLQIWRQIERIAI
jgi:hypothetical protein